MRAAAVGAQTERRGVAMFGEDFGWKPRLSGGCHELVQGQFGASAKLPSPLPSQEW
jgi:hypothetical protein